MKAMSPNGQLQSQMTKHAKTMFPTYDGTCCTIAGCSWCPALTKTTCSGAYTTGSRPVADEYSGGCSGYCGGGGYCWNPAGGYDVGPGAGAGAGYGLAAPPVVWYGSDAGVVHGGGLALYSTSLSMFLFVVFSYCYHRKTLLYDRCKKKFLISPFKDTI